LLGDAGRTEESLLGAFSDVRKTGSRGSSSLSRGVGPSGPVSAGRGSQSIPPGVPSKGPGILGEQFISTSVGNGLPRFCISTHQRTGWGVVSLGSPRGGPARGDATALTCVARWSEQTSGGHRSSTRFGACTQPMRKHVDAGEVSDHASGATAFALAEV
jgi:hypothetical protein